MEAHFWHEIWEKNQIGFHESEFNSLMVQHFKNLPIEPGDRVFIPLCGKTLDMHWMLSEGFQIVGCELSELAVIQFFDELKISPKVSTLGNLKKYHYDQIDIFVGDIFELTAEQLGNTDAIYDRGALVALPLEMRIKYCQQIKQISQNAPQFLITFEYDQNKLKGPPFAIFEKDISQYYPGDYKITLTERLDYTPGLKGLSDVQECAWILTSA